MSPAAKSLFGVLRHRDFRLLWLASSFSIVGDRIVTVALALFVTELTGSATDLGLVLAAHAIPLVGFLLIGGVWADRLPRQQLIVVTDLLRFALHALLAVLIISGEVQIWQVVAIEVAFGTAEAFFRPAATALIPQTVPEDEIQEASALIGMANNVAEFAGPALATGLVLGLGAGSAFAVDAATFLISAALVIRVRPRRRAAEDLQPRKRLLSELADGYREVRSRTWVWATLIAFSFALLFGLAPLFVLGPTVAEQQYGDIAVFGIMEAVLGAGTIAGSIAAIRWRPRHPMRTGMLLACMWAPAQLLFASGVTIVPVLVATLAAGAGIALFGVWWETALAQRIPPDKLSRVTSYDWMLSFALLPLGYVVAGPLAEAYGAIEVLVVGSAVAAVVMAAGLLPRETRMLARLGDEAPPIAAGENRLSLP